MRRHQTLFLLSICLIMAIVGCSAGDQIITPKDPGGINYPIQVKDQTGQVVEITQEPQRIVSLVPSATEIAFALGLDEQVVAVTSNDDYPAKVKSLPKVGDMKINVEQVVAQKPDLVLASPINDQETIKKLRDLGMNVLLIDANQVKEVYQSIDIVADATNRAWEAEQLVAKMEKQMRETVGQVVRVPEDKRLKVWIEVGPNLYTVGGDQFLNELVERAGGINVAGEEQGWPEISAEQVIKWQPDVILSTYGGTEEILQRKGWESVPAIKNKRVYALNPNLVSRPGPRIPQGIQQIAEYLYPDQLKAVTP